jgi:hypothetical protein
MCTHIYHVYNQGDRSGSEREGFESAQKKNDSRSMTVEIDRNKMNSEDSLQIDSCSHLAISSDANHVREGHEMGTNIAEIVVYI